jgi:hypothetical protein
MISNAGGGPAPPADFPKSCGTGSSSVPTTSTLVSTPTVRYGSIGHAGSSRAATSCGLVKRTLPLSQAANTIALAGEPFGSEQAGALESRPFSADETC